MALPVHVGALVAAASGVALAGLGLAVTRVRPRTVASVAFSAFAILWGLQVLAASTARIVPSELVAEWSFAFYVLAIPVHVPLLVFVAAFPWTDGPMARHPAAFAFVLAVPALVVLLLVAAAPGLFITGVADVTFGRRALASGALRHPVGLWASVLSFALALAWAYRKLARARADGERQALGLVVCAFLTFLSFRSGDLVGVAGPWRDVALRDGSAAYATMLAAFAAISAVVAGVVVSYARRRDLPWRDLAIACGTVPFGVALLQLAVQARGYPTFDAVGVFRVIAVVILGYAIARHRMFDAELRLRGALPAAAYVAVAASGAIAAFAAWGDALLANPPLALVAVVGIALGSAPVYRIGDAITARALPGLAGSAYARKRRLEVYRLAAEEAEARRAAGGPVDEAFLGELAQRLGVPDADARAVRAIAAARPLRTATPPGEPGRFRAERELGRGGFGRAILAHDSRLDRKVVLKEPLAASAAPEERDRALAEAKLAARVTHPNVVAVHEVLLDAGRPTLVLEHVPGGNLHDLLRRRGALPTPDAVRLALDVLAGLDAIHRAGVVHADLKPANVLLDATGRAKITDFGVARSREARVADAFAATARGGTPRYMSPEQARGDALDARSDLYSAGLVILHAFTGRAPSADHPVLDVPAPIAGVLARALAHAPDDRFPDAASMAREVRAAAIALGDDAVPPEEVPAALPAEPATTTGADLPAGGGTATATHATVAAAPPAAAREGPND